MKSTLTPTIVQPGMGKELHAFGDVLTVMLTGSQTGNQLAVMYEETPPGGGPPPHVHSREDEIFLVMDGRISYCVDDEWTEVAPGGVAYLPRGSAHTFRNIGDTPSHHWIITTPAGFENFFARCADEFAKASAPDMGRIVEIFNEHGLTIIEEQRSQ
jgi:quercetin dioxygenase-like cupin family protein